MTKLENTSNVNLNFKNTTGSIPYNMTNDYMFRAVLQKNNKVLRGLLCSLLHLDEKDISSVTITNPIVLGDALEDKEFRLDINVILNDNTLINLEMQVANQLNWKNRSISYLCRSYDQLHKGQNYSAAKPVIHIGFLDYTLFPNHPEFYATYKLMNVKNQHIYSDNFTLCVVDLTRIDLATTEDRAFHIDYWAALFKAKTWEDIKMLAENNEYLAEASETLFQLNADEQIKKRCLDREEYYQDLRSYEKAIAERDSVIVEKENIIAGKDNALSAKDNIISEKDNLISEKDNLIANLEAQLAKYKNVDSNK